MYETEPVGLARREGQPAINYDCYFLAKFGKSYNANGSEKSQMDKIGGGGRSIVKFKTDIDVAQLGSSCVNTIFLCFYVQT